MYLLFKSQHNRIAGCRRCCALIMYKYKSNKIYRLGIAYVPTRGRGGGGGGGFNIISDQIITNIKNGEKYKSSLVRLFKFVFVFLVQFSYIKRTCAVFLYYVRVS